jgi:hypothetical protein
MPFNLFLLCIMLCYAAVENETAPMKVGILAVSENWLDSCSQLRPGEVSNSFIDLWSSGVLEFLIAILYYLLVHFMEYQ